jgi:hypothetical protein
MKDEETSSYKQLVCTESEVLWSFTSVNHQAAVACCLPSHQSRMRLPTLQQHLTFPSLSIERVNGGTQSGEDT